MTRFAVALLACAGLAVACGSAQPVQRQDQIIVAPEQAQPVQPQPAQAPAIGQGQAGAASEPNRPAPAVPAPGGACTGGGRPPVLCPPP